MYICMCNSDNNNKMKMWFQKARLTVQWTSRVTAIRFISPSLWYGVVARHMALSTRYSVGHWSFNMGMWSSICWVQTWWETRTCTILDRIHAKVGDRNLCILGGLFTIEIDGSEGLVSRDVCGWWVAESFPRELPG